MKYLYLEMMKDGKPVYEVIARQHIQIYGYNKLMCAERAWEERDGSVTLVKNRYSDILTVDMKEFMWIKLKAEYVQ